ncbi:hypothetical protein QPL79_06215 [Ignisphaera sp. 4213-co]|uniref:Glucuronate isomerase n=1 Tax=Ignisphaera cupida TaxID=3050454 RepID=A0ABD4Z8R5_9CREN|nr:hypothetical protein [Ignisphaera sp. 4213-co]MDK6028953.1 hypothetical protein [Ignisphaera sp. 4213-co]
MKFDDVFNEIYNEVKNILVVDIHEHLNPEKLSHASFEDILFYHYIVTELSSSGMDRSEFEKRRGVDKLLYALPYFKYVRNTATFWSLRQMLKDLYGLDIKTIDENNWRDVVSAIESRANDEKRAFEILTKTCGVKKSFLTLNPFANVKEFRKDVFTGVLRIDNLVTYLSKDSLTSLENVTGVEIRSAEDLDKAVETLFKKFENDIVAVALSPLPSELYSFVEPSEIQLYLRELKSRGYLEPYAKSLLSSYVLQKFLDLCNEHKKVFQLMIGVERPVPGAAPPDYAITHVNYDQLINLTKLFAVYPNVKFDVISADMRLVHPLTVIAKNYRNVYVSGYWWYSMYQAIIREYLRLRIQMLPYNKTCGFFSDAYVADWVYGKVVLAKKQIAYVLSEMIYEGYIDRDLAIEIANALLHENAEKLYNL